jgi:hypothetical protein
MIGEVGATRLIDIDRDCARRRWALADEGAPAISEAAHHRFGHDLVGQAWTLDLA